MIIENQTIYQDGFNKDKVQVIIADEYFTRESVQNDSEKIYLFTENCDYSSGSNVIHGCFNPLLKDLYQNSRYSNQTQACIRGLNNAFPIITKKNQTGIGSFMDNTTDFMIFAKHLNDCFDRLEKANPDKIVISSGGFATDRAGLPHNFAIFLQYMLYNKLKLTTEIKPHFRLAGMYGLVPIKKMN
jgi:hypothetical protein